MNMSWRRVNLGINSTRPQSRDSTHLHFALSTDFRCVSLHAPDVKMVYIRQQKLEDLHPYKYAGVDNSLTSRYVLKPFYNNVVIKCFPMSMA